MNSQDKTYKEKIDIILKSNIGNIKSNIILKKIFNHIQKKKTLEIAQYNKYILQKLNLNINDYKEYSEKYSSIEIEIIPSPYIKGNFINIKNEKDNDYYHIYFNDNKKEEIKRTKLNEEDDISKITVVIDYQVDSFIGLFCDCKCISSIYFKKFYRNNINNMSGMFSNCSSLRNLNFSNFNTNNVTDMSRMFQDCWNLCELNVSNFNTHNVTNMEEIFSGCCRLEKLDLSNFNTEKVTNMCGMFFSCTSLKELNVSSFNTINVKRMKCMFFDCSSLTELNISNFNTTNVIDMNNMFCGCYNLKELNITKSNEDIELLKDLDDEFLSLYEFKFSDFSDFNIDNVEDMKEMFDGCTDELKMQVLEQFKYSKKKPFKIHY